LLLDGVVFAAKSLLLVRSNTFFHKVDGTGETKLASSDRRRIITACVLPVALIAVLDTIVWQRGEMFFLGLYTGAAATAYFASAAQIGQLFVLAPTAALSSLIPKMAEKSLGDRDHFNFTANRILNLALLSALPLYCCGVSCGPLIIHFWKPQYGAVGGILPWIMLGRMAMLISAPVSLSLYASGHERQVLKISATSASVALVADYLLISHFHLTGAAIATALNQTLSAAVTIFVGSRFIHYQLRIEQKTLAALVALAIVLAALSGTSIRTPVALACLIVCVLVLSRERFILDELSAVFPRRLFA
jgi:O-antigen/teichoic acid export membrane protein